MLIRNIKEFLEKTKTRKILALDMGKKKIGLAISDPNHKIVNPLEVLKKDKNYLDKLQGLEFKLLKKSRLIQTKLIHRRTKI